MGVLRVIVVAVLAVTLAPLGTPVAVTNMPISMSDVVAKFKMDPGTDCVALVVLTVFCSEVPKYLCTRIPVPPTVNNSLILRSKYL